MLVWEDWLSFFCLARSGVVPEAWLNVVKGVGVMDAMSWWYGSSR